MSINLSPALVVTTTKFSSTAEKKDMDMKLSHRSPSSVAALESNPPSKKSNSVQTALCDDMEGERKIVRVSPTTEFMQKNQFRSKSPTDHNRMRSPLIILRKRYMNHFHDECPSSTFSNI